MPTASSGARQAKAQGVPAAAEPQGDTRRGGWILVLIGVVLLLVALALLILL